MTSSDIHIQLTELDLVPIAATVNIARMLPQAIVEEFSFAASDPDHANMFMRMFYLFQSLGKDDFALEMQAKALERRRTFRIASPKNPTIRLLGIMGPGNMLDNTPIDFVVENGDIRLDLLFLLPGQPFPDVIPDHDIAMVLIGESTKNRAPLQELQSVIDHWPRPVINQPTAILGCGRDSVFSLLNGIEGLLVPHTGKARRNDIEFHGRPFTIRPLDTHAGDGLEKIETQVALEKYLSERSDPSFQVSEYIDYRSDDGFFRKLRVALIDSQPYICHLAISESWIVHYISANMHLSEAKRAEEALMMQNFERGFAKRHASAFSAIASRMKLDYVILDCAEIRDGRLLIFEADSRGLIHATDPISLFAYKQDTMQKAFWAFRTMLHNRLKAK